MGKRLREPARVAARRAAPGEKVKRLREPMAPGEKVKRLRPA